MATSLSFFERKKIQDSPYALAISKPKTTTLSSTQSYKPNGMSSPVPTSTPKPVVNQQAINSSPYYGTQSKPGVPSAIVPKPTVQPQAPAVNPYLEKLRSNADSRSNLQLTLADEKASTLGASRDRQIARQSAMIPKLQSNFDAFKGNVAGQIGDQEAATKEEQDYIDEVYGASLRQGAQANRESTGQLQNIFAGLGTLDSSAFQNQMINNQSKFAGKQQSTLQEKGRALAESQRTLTQFKRDAATLIQQEEVTLMEKLATIENTIDQGSTQYELAINQAYADAYDKISAIDEQLNTLEMDAWQKQQDAQATQLSSGFMSTGIPETQADFEFKAKNSGAFETKIGQASSNGESASKVRSIISQLDKVNPAGITGLMRFGVSDESRKAEGLLKQLNSELQIEEAKRLKGQGAMSDAERALLANSVAALNLDNNGRSRLSQQDFQAVLNQLNEQFGGEPLASSNNADSVRVQSPDGQSGFISVSELQDALNNGWKRI